MHTLRILPLLYALASFGKCEMASNGTEKTNTFFYFAYGSNLFKNRMHINCPNAEFYSIAKLEGWRLDFNLTVAQWNGAVATICEQPGSSVWGTLWQIPIQEMPKLDIQEGVHKGWYYARNVTVATPSGENVLARVYIEYNCPKYKEVLPEIRRPSKTYRIVIFLGAIESGLPSDYINYILSFQDNGKLAPIEQRMKLGYPFVDINFSNVERNSKTEKQEEHYVLAS